MKKGNVVYTLFLTKKELKDPSFLSSIIDLNLDIYSVYRLEINILPINCYLGFDGCNSELVEGLICLQRNEFYFDGGIEAINGVLPNVLGVSVEQGKGYMLYDDGIVCHDVFIATLVRVSR